MEKSQQCWEMMKDYKIRGRKKIQRTRRTLKRFKRLLKQGIQDLIRC